MDMQLLSGKGFCLLPFFSSCSCYFCLMNVEYLLVLYRSCSPTVFTYLLLELCGLKQSEYITIGDSRSKIQNRSHIALKHGREAKRGRQNP